MAYDADRVPAEWLRAQVIRRSRTIWLLVAAVFVVVVMMFYLGLLLHHLFLEVALLGVVIGIERFAAPLMEAFPRWRLGAEAETGVGERLNELRGRGFTVMHDIPQPGEGNVDHLVSGPSGVFMIETKLRWYKDSELAKAKRQAKRLRYQLGVFVTPVICIAERKKGRPFETKGVWVVRRDDLLEWLPKQHNRVLPFEHLVHFADSCD